jgi:serine/threonine protein kinase
MPSTIYQPGQIIDHYKIIRKLGQGPFSGVYLALDTLNQQKVVLKFPVDDVIGGAAIFARYRREAEIGRLLNHPYIQSHLHRDEKRSKDYLVLEYLRGSNLREVMLARGPLSQTETLLILSRVCEALSYAHKHGVVHRDMKPENVILLDDGSSKIIDFGIALLGGKSRISGAGFSSPIGTPDYMAPELFWGRPGSARSDVYAVGTMLYELLSDQTPFPREDAFTFVSPHIAHDPPSILLVKPDLPASLATVVMRAVRRDASARYASMDELLHDLRHLDTVRPITYVPSPPRIGGRYRQVITIGLIILVICLLMIAFGFLAQFAHTVAR